MSKHTAARHFADRRRRRLTVSIGALIMVALALSYVFAPTDVGALPPRPTPAITPTHTPTPTHTLPRTPKPTPPLLRLSHIRLLVTPAQEGLWSVVEWQGANGAWHVVEGWQGTVDAGAKRWAVYERNFGEGPFRWVIYDSPTGRVKGVSAPFTLPGNEGEELIVRIELSRD